MSLLGYKRTIGPVAGMSAVPLIADIPVPMPRFDYLTSFCPARRRHVRSTRRRRRPSLGGHDQNHPAFSGARGLAGIPRLTNSATPAPPPTCLYNGLGAPPEAIFDLLPVAYPDGARTHIGALEESPWPWCPESPVFGSGRGRSGLIAPVVGISRAPDLLTATRAKDGHSCAIS